MDSPKHNLQQILKKNPFRRFIHTLNHSRRHPNHCHKYASKPPRSPHRKDYSLLSHSSHPPNPNEKPQRNKGRQTKKIRNSSRKISKWKTCHRNLSKLLIYPPSSRSNYLLSTSKILRTTLNPNDNLHHHKLSSPNQQANKSLHPLKTPPPSNNPNHNYNIKRKNLNHHSKYNYNPYLRSVHKMEHYDVIIIGAGIAGAGLTFNLKQIDYQGKILIINKESKSQTNNTRITFAKTVQEYNLPYDFIFKGLKLGVESKINSRIKEPIYQVNYNKICKKLLNNSSAAIKNETGIKIKNNILITNKNIYSSKYIIDCSGKNFFLRRQLNLKLPSRYWKSNSKIIENKSDLDINFGHYIFNSDQGFEEIYPNKKTATYSKWFYSKNPNPINSKKSETFYNSFLQNSKIIHETSHAYPVAPTPITAGTNYAFLGDSFGNAAPLSGFGLGIILDTSKILAIAIKNSNLKYYKNTWKKRYLNTHLKQLASKANRYHNNGLIKKIKQQPPYEKIMSDMTKNHAQFFLDLCKDKKNLSIPSKIKKYYSRINILFTIYYLIKLKINYHAEERKANSLSYI